MFTVSATLQSLRKVGLVPALLSRGPLAASLLLVVLLGFRGAAFVSDLLGSRHPARQAPTASAPTLPPAIDLAGLIGAHLFGGNPAPGALPAGAPPVSNIPLVLVGVLAATDPARGVAILGPTADAAKVYLVGGVLPGGATLSAVQPDRVLINRGGAIEALLLPRHSGAAGALPPPPPPTPTAAERVQQLVQQNPGAITNVMRPQVVLVDGKQKGFRVFPGANRQAFQKMGLQPGDLVTAINGTTLDDPSVGANVFSTLATSPNARVTVVRDGRNQDLVVNVAQVVSEAERAQPAVGPAPDAGSALPSANDPATIPPP
jgi:general secretion pathway protein C